MDFVVLGNPENRRVTMFCDAARGQGLPEPQVVPWERFIDHPECLDELEGPRVLRIESLGENDRVARQLLALGSEPASALGCEWAEPADIADLQFGQILAPRQTHLGFLEVLRRLESHLEGRPDWVVPQPIASIRLCFDKRAMSERLAGVVAMPEVVHAASADEVLEHAAEGALWVKLSCGSSASGLGLVRGTRNVHMLTTVLTRGGRRFNSLRLQRLHGEALRRTLEWLLAEGVHIERDVPKARIDGAYLDVRVVVIRGEPRFAVVRQSRHPITNLHLGGQRGSLEQLWAVVGAEGKAVLLDLCRRVASEIPHWYLGLDVLVERDSRSVRLIEVNAFGDLLPRLVNAGLDTYGAEIVGLSPERGAGVLQSL